MCAKYLSNGIRTLSPWKFHRLETWGWWRKWKDVEDGRSLKTMTSSPSIRISAFSIRPPWFHFCHNTQSFRGRKVQRQNVLARGETLRGKTSVIRSNCQNQWSGHKLVWARTHKRSKVSVLYRSTGSTCDTRSATHGFYKRCFVFSTPK